MNENQLHIKLNNLLRTGFENEISEFKEAKSNFDFHKLGKYFSALSNEANLKNTDCAWLIFGVSDKNYELIGTNYRPVSKNLQSLKKEIADKTSNNISFIEIYEYFIEEKRIIMFQIPPAPIGLPIAFEGHYYGRNGESLSALNLEEIERIRSQSKHEDWTSKIIHDADISDLDEDAIKKARIEFKKRNPKYNNEVDTWDDIKFLNKARLTIKGKITNASMILLGKEESEHFLGSSVKIRWNLKTIENQDKDFEVFSIPFILAVDEIYKKIRNLKYRFLRDGSLFPDEFLRYDPFTIREPLHNAIAHQDYTKGAYVNITEFEDDHLVYTNIGHFLPKSVEDVVLQDSPHDIYRNPFLVSAMKTLDMIETQGGGIKKIFNYQRLRFFPMPDYDLRDGKVKICITGKILNEDFARILIKNPQLSLKDILLLDKVQKQKLISDDEYKYLKKNKFIEGRKNNLFLSSKVLELIDNEELKAEYIANRSLDDTYFKELIVEYIKKFTVAKRSAIDTLILPKLSATLSMEKKKKKVENFLTLLRIAGKIKTNNKREWILGEI
jgi:ATP-dependent DNA helicase RecG